MKKWMSVVEVAEYLGVHTQTIYKYLDKKKNKIPSYKIGKLHKFDSAEVDKWVRANKKIS